eukprot:jgi/Botrbrau1/3787/Bobra.0183s0021.1
MAGSFHEPVAPKRKSTIRKTTGIAKPVSHLKEDPVRTEDDEEKIYWDFVPNELRSISLRRPGHGSTRRTLQELLETADKVAADDFEKYGCELRGCVKQLPVLRPGERMVLDHVLSPTVSRAYEQLLLRNKIDRQMNFNLEEEEEEEGDEDGHRKEETSQSLLKQNLLPYLKRNAGLGTEDPPGGRSNTMKEKAELQHLLDNLPETCEVHQGLEVYVVPEDDPLNRTALIGELGVRTTMRLEKGDILGFYRGYTSYAFEHEQSSHVSWPLMTGLGVKEGVGADIMAAEYKYRMEQYSLGQDLNKLFLVKKRKALFDGDNPLLTQFGSKSASQRDKELVTNAYSYGNILCLVNDPHSDSGDGEANVHIGSVQLNGFPFSFMYARKTIEAGQDLRYSYGPEYWQLMKQELRFLKVKWHQWSRGKRDKELKRRAAEEQEKFRKEVEELKATIRQLQNEDALKKQPEDGKGEIEDAQTQNRDGERGRSPSLAIAEKSSIDANAGQLMVVPQPEKPTSGGVRRPAQPMKQQQGPLDQLRRKKRRDRTPDFSVQKTVELDWLQDVLPMLKDLSLFKVPDPVPSDPRFQDPPMTVLKALAEKYKRDKLAPSPAAEPTGHAPQRSCETEPTELQDPPLPNEPPPGGEVPFVPPLPSGPPPLSPPPPRPPPFLAAGPQPAPPFNCLGAPLLGIPTLPTPTASWGPSPQSHVAQSASAHFGLGANTGGPHQMSWHLPGSAMNPPPPGAHPALHTGAGPPGSYQTQGGMAQVRQPWSAINGFQALSAAPSMPFPGHAARPEAVAGSGHAFTPHVQHFGSPATASMGPQQFPPPPGPHVPLKDPRGPRDPRRNHNYSSNSGLAVQQPLTQGASAGGVPRPPAAPYVPQVLHPRQPGQAASQYQGSGQIRADVSVSGRAPVAPRPTQPPSLPRQTAREGNSGRGNLAPSSSIRPPVSNVVSGGSSAGAMGRGSKGWVPGAEAISVVQPDGRGRAVGRGSAAGVEQGRPSGHEQDASRKQKSWNLAKPPEPIAVGGRIPYEQRHAASLRRTFQSARPQARPRRLDASQEQMFLPSAPSTKKGPSKHSLPQQLQVEKQQSVDNTVDADKQEAGPEVASVVSRRVGKDVADGESGLQGGASNPERTSIIPDFLLEDMADP